MTIYYLDNDNGVDDAGRDGLSAGTAWKTLEYARISRSAFAAGNTIRLATSANPYLGNTAGAGYLSLYQALASDCTIESVSGVAANVIIEGTAAGDYSVKINGSHYKLRNITIRMATATTYAAIGGEGSASNITLDGCVIVSRSSPTVTHRGLALYGASGSTMATWAVNNCTFSAIGTDATVVNIALVMNAGSVVDGVTITGATATSQLQCVSAVGPGLLKHLTISGGSYNSATGFGVYIDSVSGQRYQNITITGATVIGYKTAALLWGIDTLTVTGGFYSSVTGAGMAFGPDDNSAVNPTTGTLTGTLIRAWGGHGLIVGANAQNVTVSGVNVVGGNYGLVLKECFDVDVVDSIITGGVSNVDGRYLGPAVFFKAATRTKVRRCQLTSQLSQYGAIFMDSGGTGHTNLDCELTDNWITAEGATDAFYHNVGADAGGFVCDRNTYAIVGSGNYGRVNGVLGIATIAALRTAWSTYGDGTNDAASVDAVHGVDISAALQAIQAKTDNLDARVSSRLALSDYALPDNAGIAAIRAKTDLIGFSGTDVKATLDGETVAMAVAERNALADAILLRDVAFVEDSAAVDSLCYVVLAMAHSNTFDHTNTLTVFKTDGMREFVRKSVQIDPSAAAIAGIG
jgi:hypothetical protein